MMIVYDDDDGATIMLMCKKTMQEMSDKMVGFIIIEQKLFEETSFYDACVTILFNFLIGKWLQKVYKYFLLLLETRDKKFDVNCLDCL